MCVGLAVLHSLMVTNYRVDTDAPIAELRK